MMPHVLAQSVEILTTAMAVAGMIYFLAAWIAARRFLAERRAPLPDYAPGVSILKPLKGLDPGLIDALRSHCEQSYPGKFELLFGFSSLSDPAVPVIQQLIAEFPGHPIWLVECTEQLGTNGKVSALIQLVPHARYNYLIISDSDITVEPHYLERIMACFEPEDEPSEADAEAPVAGQTIGLTDALITSGIAPVGLVTALYRGRANGTLASRFEALGIATDFQAGVLLSRMIEGGLHYGLGATLAISSEALEKIGGLEPLVDYLADDYELGARVAAEDFRVVLSAEVVETAIPAYGWRGFFDHQLRWARTVRDARPWGYAGLIFTHGLCWAALNVVASGLSPVSLWLLGLSFFLRLAMAMTVGSKVLGDSQVLPSLWLLPIRDLVAMCIWIVGLTGNTIVWRGERFALRDGRLEAEGL